MCGDFLSARMRLATSKVIVAEPFGWSGAAPGKCWHNVSQLTQLVGGTFAYGWALGAPGPIVSPRREISPLYTRWVNHILWRDDSDCFWEVTPVLDELDRTITWEPTHFVADDEARFEIATDDICCPQPSVYVAVRPEGEWTADCLCQAERASRETQDLWIERAVCSIRNAGLQPTNWRVRRVGDLLRDIWIMAE
jgi:hypothetical protein